MAQLLNGARIVVSTGNTESVLAALDRGIPLVVVPSILDQSEIGWRVAESGAGVRLSERRCSPARLREAVELVLRDPSFRENARRMSEDLQRQAGARRAAEVLTGLANRRMAQPREEE